MIGFEGVRDRQLAILLEFDRFTKQHGLTYWLAYGTLLGAVRHGGFIPWDDDIDLIMPYGDYRRFCEIINAQNNGGMLSDRYRVADYYVDSSVPYHQVFMKIYDIETRAISSSLDKRLGFEEGVFIDIFCLTGFPDDPSEQAKVREELDLYASGVYYSTLSLASIGARHIRTLMKSAAKKARVSSVPHTEWIRRFKELESSLPNLGTTTCAIDAASSCYTNGFLYRSDVWYPQRLAAFEGTELPVPSNYEGILTARYGDYLTLPPVDQRIPSHEQCYVEKRF